MNIHLLLLLLMILPIYKANQIDVPVSFRKLGNYATGLSYAHLKTSIDIGNVRKIHWQALNMINATAKNAADLSDNSVNLFQLFTKLEKSLIPSTNLIDAISSTFVDPNEQNPRQKRQMELLGVFSIGVSLYNTYEIYQLHSELSDLKSGMELIAHSILEEDLALKDLENSVGHLNKTCFILTQALFRQENKLNHLAAFDEMSILTTEHNTQMNRWGEGMTNLLHGQLSPLLVKNKAMMVVFKELKGKIEDKGFKMLRENPSDVYKEDISYLVQGTVVHIYVHIPIIEREPLSLYEHINVPFFADNNGALVTLEDESNILAIDETTKNGRVLTSSELAGCKKQPHHEGNIYLCGAANLVNTNVLRTCLGLLFSGSQDAQEINTKCKLFISQEKSFAKQLTKNSFLLFNKIPKKITYKCGSNQKHEMITGLSTIMAEPGCQVFTDDYFFYSKIDVTIEGEFMTLPRKINFTFQEMPLSELALAYHELSLITHPKKRSIESVKIWLDKERAKTMIYQRGILAFVIAIVLILIICAYLLFTYLKYKRAKVGSVKSADIDEGLEMAALNTAA